MLVPVGVIAQAAGVAAYPFLARLVAEGKLRELTQTVTRAIRYVVVFSLAAAAALVALALPAVRVLYQRGSFDAGDTIATAGALAFFALGIPLWGVQQILARGFYAREQMWAPVIVGTAATVVALPVYWGLHEAMGVNGLALASTISIAVYTIALAAVWYARTGWEHLRPVLATTFANLPLAAAAGLAAWAAAEGIQAAFDPPGFLASGLAAAVGGLLVLVITLAPPPVRRSLARS